MSRYLVGCWCPSPSVILTLLYDIQGKRKGISLGPAQQVYFIINVLQALELIERRYGVMPNIFSSDTEDLDASRSDESDGWPDCDDVMTELKNKSAYF